MWLNWTSGNLLKIEKKDLYCKELLTGFIIKDVFMSKPLKIVFWIGLSAILSLSFYGCIEWIHVHRGISYGDLTRDPNAIHNSPKYIGLLSQTGMIFWFGTAGILLFSGFFVQQNHQDKKIFYFLTNAFLLTLFLGLDDLFMFHDELAHRGIREEYFYIFYAIWLLTTLIFFRRMIKNTLYPLILVYGTVFGCSIIIDKLIAEAYLIEDMLKFVGILNWSFYWTTSAFGLVQKNRVKQD